MEYLPNTLRISTPCGDMIAMAVSAGLVRLDFTDRVGDIDSNDGCIGIADAHLRLCRDEISRYFTGELRAFSVPLALDGTPFQHRVWDSVRRIPYGTTLSYSEVAALLGNPLAARAVGAANARNPVSVIIPCHRLIGRHGQLTGYAGGLERKRRLLELEMRWSPPETSTQQERQIFPY